jgi:hypothetical protein
MSSWFLLGGSIRENPLTISGVAESSECSTMTTKSVVALEVDNQET